MRYLASMLMAAGVSMLVFAGAFGAKSKVKLPQDSGPDKIDVSAYPPEMVGRYKTFRRICAKCHSLARPINTSMPSGSWARYVGIMVDKSPEPISDADAKGIAAFLIYDQEQRKDKNPSSFYPPLTEEELEKLRKP